jgi:LmbE family N-acetylglucosaminyl deacetylase
MLFRRYMSKKNKAISILAIVAHPDDVDITSGGSISKWVNEGVKIHYCIVSDGCAGLVDTNFEKNDEKYTRRREQEQAAAILGVKDVLFLGLPDGQIQPSLELRLRLAAIIRQLKPNKVITHAPIFNLKSIRYSHPDHLAVGQAVMAAVFPDARSPQAFMGTELPKLEPHSVDEVWMMGTTTPNTYIDITNFIKTKIDAILCHKSQLGDFGDVNDYFLTWGRELAVDAGYSDGLLAEAFYVMDTR